MPRSAPGLSGRIAEDCRDRRDLVAGRDVDAVAGGVEPPMVIGAADLPVDALAQRQIGAEMRAPGVLHDRPARAISISDNSGSEKIDADDGPIVEVACQAHGKPGPVKS